MSIYRHSAYARLIDEDLKLAMVAVRRELQFPQPSNSFLSSDRSSPVQLTTALALMQQELDYRQQGLVTRITGEFAS